jgi:hypothetical protein
LGGGRGGGGGGGDGAGGGGEGDAGGDSGGMGAHGEPDMQTRRRNPGSALFEKKWLLSSSFVFHAIHTTPLLSAPYEHPVGKYRLSRIMFVGHVPYPGVPM